MNNKSRFLSFAKAAGMILWGSVSLGTSIAVWNASVGTVPDGFICLVAGLNVIISGAAIWLVGKKTNIEED